MYDQNRLGVELHLVEHLCLAEEIPDAFANQFAIGTGEHGELRRMRQKPNVERLGLVADSLECGATLADHRMELRHIWVRGIRCQVRRHSIHVDVVGDETVECRIEIFERNLEVGIAGRRRASFLEIVTAHDFDGKAKNVMHAFSWCLLRSTGEL